MGVATAPKRYFSNVPATADDGSSVGMGHKQIIHFVEPESRVRAELARVAFGLGHHAEVYADTEELLAHPPAEGVLALHDDGRPDGIAEALERLTRVGVWLPLLAMDHAPRTRQVVAAIKAGALDFLPLPLAPARLAQALAGIEDEAQAHAEARMRMMEARDRIARLSHREREVLDWLTEGNSNKTIARELAISPRTVEIHRANMMSKLGARHAAEAVRLRLEARLDPLH
jgi:FixJ family two-component response regulator